MKKTTLDSGVDLYINKSDKFKTWSASIYIYRPLSEKEAAYNALLAKVLKNSCAKYPTRAKLTRRQEMLYGASFMLGVRKYADTHALVIKFNAVCDRFLPEKISGQVFELAKEIITAPNVKNGAFDKQTVELEKLNLKKQIEAYINNKSQYADKRCIEILCEGNPYAADVNGSIEELEEIDEKSLYEHYLELMKNSKKDVFICGDADEKAAMEVFGDFVSNGSISKPTVCAVRAETAEVAEEMEVTQGKLVMGFKTNINSSEKRCAAMIFNAVFGGSPVSKLFNNVRERLSLAYYASSAIGYAKGFMLVRSGIECEKYEQVKGEILRQLEEICKGNITDEEMANALSHNLNIYGSLEDDPDTAVAVKTGWITEGEQRNVEEIIEGMKKVTKADVIEIAKSYKLDTVYFLKGQEVQE